MDDLTNSTDVVSTSDVGKMSWFVLEPFDNLVLFKVEFDCVSLSNFWVGESDGSWVVSDDVGDFILSDGFGLDLKKFVFGLSIFNFVKNESTLDVIEESVVLVGLDDGKDVLNSDGELGVGSNFIINFDAGLFILANDGDLSAIEGELKMMSA